MGLELKKAIETISKERRIDKDVLIDTIEEAVKVAVNKRYHNRLDIEVNYNEDSGEIEVYKFKRVVEEVEDEDTEISYEDAKEIDENVQIGDEVGFKLEVEDLGRIAAQAAKQVIIQRMRDAEQEIIYEEYKDRVGEIVSGTVQRRERAGLIINLGRTEALLPNDEQIPTEHYKRGDRIDGYIIEVKKESRGPQIILSRSHPSYMEALFKREVPEVSDGTVKIMGIAREPGVKAKVAVYSKDRDVDPIGACVGVRGSRINKIIQEFKGEKIDLVVWSPNITTYAVNALSPARITSITVDEDEKSLEVVVPDNQYYLAVGKKGINVKLASKLLGWHIDIITESRYGEIYQNRQKMEQIAGVVELGVDVFYDAGFYSLEDLKEASDEEILSIEGMDEKKLEELKSALNLLTA